MAERDDQPLHLGRLDQHESEADRGEEHEQRRLSPRKARRRA